MRLDEDTVNALRELGGEDQPELLAVLLETYLQDSVARLATLRRAIEQADPVTLRRESHALKGASLAIGACRMSQCYRRLEEEGRSGSTGGAPVLLAEAEEEFRGLGTELAAILAAERGRP